MFEAEGTIAVAHGRLLYRRAWLPEGPARGQVVLVHGFGDHGGRFLPLVEPFVAAGLAVHALDLPGHGRSPGQRGHIGAWHEYGDAVIDLLEAIQSAAPQPRPTFLFGHSLGGVIVLELGLRRGEALAAELGLGAWSSALRPSRRSGLDGPS